MISLIAAMDDNRLIGRDNALPWRLPNDLKYFKRSTLDKIVLMGRKTWDSLGRPLPQRDNWVLTRDPAFAPAGARVFHDLDQAFSAAAGKELVVIGGAELYRQALPRVRRMYLTEVHGRFEGDAWFPEFDPAGWRETAREDHPADAQHACAYSFVCHERR
ncbi:dihydrofolate reductase [Solimonas sp. K1W22B-7]|uniref:dihydrofolate reductase n=1 Tax=Solimonas sp. K1W22B-7 TaxID=2303331 RepID=UPI000E32D9D3|nr:dihydrofolate reductase [Solimonas sp. K1W22B-7]AXQ29770.1 dihydrofolate reductase [Solimonas sp. K1W22B-7]